MHHFAVLDVETTGLFPERYDRIVEVAVVELTPHFELVNEYATLVNPNRDLGPTSIHGIRAHDVLEAPPFEEVADDLVERLAGRVIVGHNVQFDLRFVAAEFRRMGLSLPTGLSLVDTMNAVGGRSLEDACAAYRIDHANAHSALDDARATSQLLEALGVVTPTAPPPREAWPRLAYVPTEYRRPPRGNAPAEQRRLSFSLVRGMSVCFTGESTIFLNGELLSRRLAQELAERAGLVVRPNVTKKLGILVASDPDSLSGKAKKARGYGIPIADERSFWSALGLQFA